MRAVRIIFPCRTVSRCLTWTAPCSARQTPTIFDYTPLKYCVLEDPDYRDRASDFEKKVANKIKEQNETGASFPGLEVDHGKSVAFAFAGMTVAEFNAYIQEFKKQPMPSYDDMLWGDGWYLPMLEIVEFLKANDFTVYIVSGTDCLIVRGIVYDSPLDLPNRQIIGSGETIVASGQGDADGLNYVFTEEEQLILGGDFLVKNLKMNKVSVIMQEICQQPFFPSATARATAAWRSTLPAETCTGVSPLCTAATTPCVRTAMKPRRRRCSTSARSSTGVPCL